MKGLILQFQVFKLFVLAVAIAFEHICEIVNTLRDFLVKFLELGLGAFLQFF